jgi:hypothetical protein
LIKYDLPIHVGDVFYQFKRRENTARFTTQHHIDENELKRQDPQVTVYIKTKAEGYKILVAISANQML